MRLLPRALIVAGVIVAALGFCGAAGAANVTIGPNLSGSGWLPEQCDTTTCTVANFELGGTGPTLTSPVSGAVVRFSVLGGATAGTYRLRTVRPGESPVSWFFKKEAAPVPVVPGSGVQSYGATLPIAAGEGVALTMSDGASIAFQEHVGRSTWWELEPPESSHTLGISEPGVYGLSAEVQPAPTISSLGTTSGPMTGGTSVTITGNDLENASGVTFGTGPAASFVVNSETQITAVTPAYATAGAVPVSVTTLAGKGTSPQSFTYVTPVYCVVPNLKGRTLRAAKAALVKAKCKVGTISKLAGATAKTGRVSRQNRVAGTQLPVGTKVAVTLKARKPVVKKHGKKK